MFVETRGLKKSYGTREILKGIDLRLVDGAITGIAGPNGCGKSTFIKCLLGLVVPDSGEIFFDGESTSASGEFRRRIGYMPQDPDFPSNLNLGELLEMVQDLRKERATAKDDLLTYFKLENDLTRNFGQLSGGTKQKFAAVVALMFEAPLLILDEPTAGLDPTARVRFRDLIIEKASEGRTVLFVSHFMSEIETMAGNVIFMNDGQLAYTGRVEEIVSKMGETNLEHALTSFFLNARKDDR